jgi:hypothetical protein
MRTETIIEVQDFLTIVKDNIPKKIVDVKVLLMIHPIESIILFFRSLLREYKKKLRESITTAKTSPEVNELIVVMFRLHMAILCLEEEVRKDDEFKQRAGKGGKFQRRNRRRHRRPREREDAHHDGKDRQTGDGTRCFT